MLQHKQVLLDQNDHFVEIARVSIHKLSKLLITNEPKSTLFRTYCIRID